MQKTNGFWCQPKRVSDFLWIAVLALFLNGCSAEKKTEISPQTSGHIKLIQTDFRQLPGWQKENFSEVIPVFRKNCAAVLQNKKEYLYNAQIKIKTADMQQLCHQFTQERIQNAAQMKKFLETQTTPYAITDNGNADGKFTSYYEAEIRASATQTDRYKYPIYGKPTDLIETNPHDFDDSLPSVRLVGRVENGRFVPYYDRRHIEKNTMNAPVLMWGDDLVDIHFMQIQGSAVAKMTDGSEVRIGFADSNGRKFKGIGSILLAEGVIEPKDSSMPKIREWLRKNPHKAADLMARNERFIFQRIHNADGPLGAMGIPLVAGRSLAVDHSFIPLGAVMWLATQNPDHEPIEKVVFAQDIGSAIKGIVRGDYFWGHGEEALYHAGRMNSVGKYYLLAPKHASVKAP